MKRLALALSGVLLVAPARFAPAQAPAGPAFIVNTTTAARQLRPALDTDEKGNFVVVWHSNQNGYFDYDVFGQRFDAAGGRVGGEFRVNAGTLGMQGFADVAMDARGDFVVVWEGGLGRRFDRRGAPAGPDFPFSVPIPGRWVGKAAVDMDRVGNFVVVWTSFPEVGTTYVLARRFDTAGTPQGNQFKVAEGSAGEQDADVTYLGDGSFVVAWRSFGASGVVARRFAADGTPMGAELPLAPPPRSNPSVAASSGDRFMVTWFGYGLDGSSNAILGVAGPPVGPEFRVNTHTTGSQTHPSVAGADGGGNLVVGWASYLQDGSRHGIYAQRLDPFGQKRGVEFQVNVYTSGDQHNPALAMDAAGNFIVAWTSEGEDGDGRAVVARRFQGLVPTALAVDTVTGNGVLEPDETAHLEPSWHNTTIAAQPFTGGISRFIGPTPATYAIDDAVADYSTADPGQTVTCTANCYAVTVTAGTRPVRHWDASVLESLGGASAAASGLQKRWNLHVGDSFTDVPRGNAFYRHVETLLHHGVTTGCGADTYCPASSVTREQMAPFALVAKEGTGYAPPACGTPVFPDVPASSPFCRWIGELARRGVVSGCGGGNYCPADPVTREQMAVFVLRTLDPALNPPTCTTPMFADVPASSPFCRWIEELARRGVVTGCGGGNYCPGDAVTREQMSVFLSATFGLTLYGP